MTCGLERFKTVLPNLGGLKNKCLNVSLVLKIQGASKVQEIRIITTGYLCIFQNTKKMLSSTYTKHFFVTINQIFTISIFIKQTENNMRKYTPHIIDCKRKFLGSCSLPLRRAEKCMHFSLVCFKTGDIKYLLHPA